MYSAFNLFVIPNSMFTSFFYMKGQWKLWRNSILKITIIIIYNFNLWLSILFKQLNEKKMKMCDF